VHWNYINENYQVVRVEGDSYDCARVLNKTNQTRLYRLTLSYEFDVIHLDLGLCRFHS